VRRPRPSEVLVDDGQVERSVADRECSCGEQTNHSFHHESLFYAGEDGFLEGTLPFIKGALADEEPLLVAVGDDKIRLLNEALGVDAGRVCFTDMYALGRNPARIIPAWREFLEQHTPDGRLVSGISEPVWSGRSQAELTECQRHESLLNLAFDNGQASRLLCTYDVADLDEQIIQGARRSHPFITEDGASKTSDAYVCAHEAPGPFDGTLADPSMQPVELPFTRDELGSLRSSVARWATDAPLSAERADRLVLSVNELATNSVRYGGGRGVLRMWREEETLLCEVHDRGRIEEPLVGRIAPKPDQLAGRGLWFVNQLCDLVQIRSTSTGNVVRLHLRLP
jgi:anti-sigma regulatory factor (Ser/Thr protein kinase)